MSNQYGQGGQTQDFLSSDVYRQELAAQRTFMAGVYGWMTIGLLVTAVIALGLDMAHLNKAMLKSSGIFFGVLIAQLVVGFGFGFILNKINAAVAGILFLVYAALLGVTFSLLFLIYTSASIYGVFFITAGMFGTMSAWGYVTKKDLTGMGSFLMMALMGLIIASIVNFFLPSSMLNLIISYAGVVIFVGLTAYHTQKFKQLYAEGGSGSDTNKKIAIYGAFMLYLDFVNMFIYLLRILGSRRD